MWIYGRSTSLRVYRYSQRLALIGTPNKLTVKVPNYINIDQGSCASQITIGVAGWLLQLLGIVPPPQRAPGEEPWILCCTPYHQLPARLCNGLVVNINMGLGCIAELCGLQQFSSDSRETIQELDALYIIGRARWMKDIVNGMPVGVEKVKCEESDDDVDEIGEDDDDCLEFQKRTTPAKRKRESREQDTRDDRDDRSSTSPSNLPGAWICSKTG